MSNLLVSFLTLVSTALLAGVIYLVATKT